MTLPARNRVIRPLLAAALTSVCLPAPASLAQTATITDISTQIEGKFKLTVPTVETTDASLDEAEIRTIFAGDIAGTASELAALDAASIRIPEIRIEYEVPSPSGGAAQKSVLVYRDLELADVSDGVAQSASVGSAEVDAGEGVRFTFGRMSAGRLDIGGLLGFYGLGTKAGSQEIRPVYADFVFDGMEIKGPEFSCEVGPARTAEFAARPLQYSFQDMMVHAQQLEAAEKAGSEPSPEVITRMIAFYVDFLTAFKSSPTEFDGLTCSGKDDEGNKLEVRSGALTIGGFEPGTYPEISLNDLRIDVENEGWLELANFTWKAMDFSTAIATLKGAGTAIDQSWLKANWRKLIPVFDGLSISGFGIDVPDEEKSGERIQASIGGLDVSLADYVNGIPASVALSGADIEIALPADAGPEVAALGIEKVDLDYHVAVHWDEATETIVVDRVEFSSAEIGAVRLSGTLGGATSALFSSDIETATAAAMDLTFKDLQLDVTDEGITSVIIALAAKEEKLEPAAFRAVLSGLAQALPLALLGANEEAVAVGTALREFVDGRPNLSLTVTATDPAGIALAELEALEKDPAAIAGKLSITAEASGEPRPLAELAPPAEPQTSGNAAEDASPRDTEKRGTKQ